MWCVLPADPKNAVVLVKGEAQRSWQESREEPTRPGGESRHPGALMGPGPRFGHQYGFQIEMFNSRLPYFLAPHPSWYGYTKTRQARQNCPRRSQTKKWLVLSGFLHQKFAGNLKQVGQIVPDCARQHQNFPLFTKKTESGVVWHNLANLFQVSCKLLVQEAR